MSRINENLLHKQFGNLKVIGMAEPRLRRTTKTKTYYWICECSCGKVIEVSTQKLKKGQKSCGCIRINKLEYGKAFLNKRFYKYKKDAKKRNLAFLLGRKFFEELLKGDCFYCGTKPHIKQKSNYGFNGIIAVNGIDRLNADLGYTPDNVVSCCFICNRAKNDLSKTQFLDWIKLVMQHSITNYK